MERTQVYAVKGRMTGREIQKDLRRKIEARRQEREEHAAYGKAMCQTIDAIMGLCGRKS
jgi:hypothetical protein